MFPSRDAARACAERLHTSAFRSPAHAEHTYLKAQVLLCLSLYLTERAADTYAAALDAITNRVSDRAEILRARAGTPGWIEWPP